MNNNREIAENAQVRLPTSVVRTISLEKLRQPSPLTEHQNSTFSLIQISKQVINQELNLKKTRKCIKKY